MPIVIPAYEIYYCLCVLWFPLEACARDAAFFEDVIRLFTDVVALLLHRVRLMSALHVFGSARNVLPCG